MTGIKVKLTFAEELIKQPVIAMMVREFDVTPNIRRASVDDEVGWVVCEIDGDHGEIERAVAWLREKGVQVDQLGDIVES